MIRNIPVAEDIGRLVLGILLSNGNVGNQIRLRPSLIFITPSFMCFIGQGSV